MDFSQNLGKAASCSTQHSLLPCFQVDTQPMPWCPPAKQATPGDSGQPEATIHFCPCGPYIFTLPSYPSFFLCPPLSWDTSTSLLRGITSLAFLSSGSDNSVLPSPDLQVAVYPHPSLIQTLKAPNRQGTHSILAMLDTP